MLIEENIIIGGKIKDMAEMSIKNPEYLQQFDKQTQNIINLFIKSQNLNTMANQDYKNKMNPDSNPLNDFQRDSDFIDTVLDDIDNKRGSLWKKDFTTIELAKELDKNLNTNIQNDFHFNSREGYKIIELIKELEKNNEAKEAVLNYYDNMNNLPQKPNSKDYFSNDFIEANLTTLERYEKDLMQYAVSYKEAEQKLASSADALWDFNIDPMDLPNNLNESYKAINTIFQDLNFFSNTKQNNMENSNEKYLIDQVKYTGFKLSDTQMDELKNSLNKGENFTINVSNKQQAPGGVDAKVDYALNFEKSNKGDIFFFNSYEAALTKKNAEGEDIVRNHSFQINNQKGAKNITALEAFNLLDGRFINKDLTNKEGQKANYWMSIDFEKPKNEHNNYNFKMFHENYGFDLKNTLEKYPVTSEVSEQTINSLKKGNRMEMSMALNGDNNSDKVFVDVNPQMKALNLHDENGGKLFFNNTQSQKVDVAETKEETKSRGVKM